MDCWRNGKNALIREASADMIGCNRMPDEDFR